MTNSKLDSNSEKKVDDNSTVSIYFSLTLPDGTPFDATQDGEPMTFTMGDSSMIPPLEEVILGLSVGDKQQVSLDPRDTFGFPDEENKHWMNKPEFDEDMELEEGLMIEFGTPAGDQVPGIILELTEDKVLVDFNHPLAGHEVIFSVEVIDIK
ncbi:MAG: peptidylprolyl isomerase [Thiohalomonas sp.]|nr:peptidylprolyl isomerase [Thiohalomonas sp.]